MNDPERDDFFMKTNCDRCGKKLVIRIMSMFNTDCICPECKDKEMGLPQYRMAQEAERAALAAGDRNFAGIGYPA